MTAKSRIVTSHYPSIGAVRFEHSKRARRLNISIKSDSDIRVAVPAGVSFSVARQFFNEHLDWVLKSIRRLKHLEKSQPITDFTNVTTREHRLVLRPDSSTQLTLKVADGAILVKYPRTLCDTDPVLQFIIRKGLIEAYRIEAKNYLPGRIAQLADQFGFKYKNVYIKNMKSRWGSCSAKNNINLNLQLLRFDNEVIDYVILHELLHTKIRNHSAIFWRNMEKLMPKFQQLRAELKQYTILKHEC